MKLLKGNKLSNYVDQGFWNMQPRQSLPEVFIRNGSIYLINRDSFMQTKQLIGENCLGYQMSDNESINIDSYLDLMLAEILLKRGKNA
jgi:CMP-N-acetylneuraminic acid synthetase